MKDNPQLLTLTQILNAMEENENIEIKAELCDKLYREICDTGMRGFEVIECLSLVLARIMYSTSLEKSNLIAHIDTMKYVTRNTLRAIKIMIQEYENLTNKNKMQ